MSHFAVNSDETAALRFIDELELLRSRSNQRLFVSQDEDSAARLPVSSLHMLVPLNIIITIATFIPPSGLPHCVGEMWGELDEGWLGGSSSRTLVHAGAWAFPPASCSSCPSSSVFSPASLSTD